MEFNENRNFTSIAFGPHENEVVHADHGHYTNVGKVIVRWAKDRDQWPADIAAFEQQLNVTRVSDPNLNAWIYIPAIYTKITIVQAGDGTDEAIPLSGHSTITAAQTGSLSPRNDFGMRTLQGSTPGAEFVLRLPPASQVAESEDRVANAFPYGSPNLYNGFSNAFNSDLDVFYARVADYTMRGCR